MIENLEYLKKWWKKYPSEKKKQFAVDNVVSAIRDTFLSEFPWKTNAAWKEEIQKINKQANRKVAAISIANIDDEARSHSLNRWDQKFGTRVDIINLDVGRQSPGYDPKIAKNDAITMEAAQKALDYATSMEMNVGSNKFIVAGKNTWQVLAEYFKSIESRARLNDKAS